MSNRTVSQFSIDDMVIELAGTMSHAEIAIEVDREFGDVITERQVAIKLRVYGAEYGETPGRMKVDPIARMLGRAA